MKKLLYMFMLCALLIGCQHIREVYDAREDKDTIEFIEYIDESPIDTEVIDRIYNAESIDEIFPNIE